MSRLEQIKRAVFNYVTDWTLKKLEKLSSKREDLRNDCISAAVGAAATSIFAREKNARRHKSLVPHNLRINHYRGVRAMRALRCGL